MIPSCTTWARCRVPAYRSEGPRMRNLDRLDLGAVAGTGWLLAATLMLGMLAGCGDRYSDEMREQETVMATETAEWNTQLGRWEQDMKVESLWLSSHPAPPADAQKADAYREHEER